jgi:Iap family predicted aminopeptidase
MKKISTLLFLFVYGLSLHAQPPVVNEQALKDSLKKHIAILAHDSLEGRETGSAGEAKAYHYLSNQFRKLGLLAAGTRDYLQPFTFTARILMGKNNAMMLNGKKFSPGKDFYPLAYSANASVKAPVIKAGYGIIAPELNHDDYHGKDVKGKIVLLEISSPEGDNPHSKFAPHTDLRTKIDKAIKQGAAGIIFINTRKDVENPPQTYSRRVAPSEIPVVFATGKALKTLLDATVVNADITAELIKEEKTGHNVVALLDKGANNTVVIGAHYDHLGYGHDGSLYRGKPAIHNGADDNASGTAALIELARLLSQPVCRNNNYLFIAFSGEEMGLLGSSYFVKNPTIDTARINYMLNMDMIGRLKPDTRILQVLGAGTSPEFKSALEGLMIDSITVKTSESGIGPSDHTSFYLAGIPAVHFFSGTHEDYHKPSDDEDKINYDGQASIIKLILEVISRLDSKGKIPFSKTQDSDSRETPRFKVTLGVVPDYAYEGTGMRLDGVSDGKPAAKAGLKAGDIILAIGEHQVHDMMSYMQALGKFKKGDKAIVKFKRGEEEKESEVEF